VRETDQAIFGSGNNCKDVDLRITNYGSERKIRAVQFKSTSSSDWVYEDLDDRVLSDGEDHPWTPSLKDAKGDHIIWWRVKYSRFGGYIGGIKQWNPDEYSEPMRAAEGDDIKCEQSSNFSLTLTNANE
jgi:hypothetical protein